MKPKFTAEEMKLFDKFAAAALIGIITNQKEQLWADERMKNEPGEGDACDNVSDLAFSYAVAMIYKRQEVLSGNWPYPDNENE